MSSQPSLNTSGELLHPSTIGNVVGHEDRLLFNNALNAFPSSQKNKLLEALSSMLNVLEQNHGTSKDVANVQGLNSSIKTNLHAPPRFFFSKALSSLPNDAIKDVNGVFTKSFADTLKSSPAASIPSSEMDAHEVNNDDKLVEEVQVDSLAIMKVSSGSEKNSLKASNILSSPKIVAFSPSELEVVEVGSSNSNLVKTMDATKASNMISFNMNDDASTRQHTGPIILHNSTPILNPNTSPMESDLQDQHSFKDNTSVDVEASNSNSLNNFSGKDDKYAEA
ncbi:hypothetical protein LWI29_012238 [Acer saccharum]|uniref:Uncharacterized protein n=1 Tax=Acer saccharum TaxID=4024 RepID=A0AA39VC29_ACESA|nr:hypothetical protein LWI29_012238 [Acer saccharum]